MRFTSPDPAAAPFYNLHHYAGNSPAAFYDPDGLNRSPGDGTGYWYSDWVVAGWRITQGLKALVLAPYQTSDHYVNDAPEPELTQMYRQLGNNYEARQQLLEQTGDNAVVSHGSAVVGLFGDLTGATGVAEYATETDSVTGNKLSEHEANVRGIVGGFGLVTTAMGGARVINGTRSVIKNYPSKINGLVPKRGQGARLLQEYRGYRAQGYSPKVSRSLTRPYEGQGQHVIQQHAFNRFSSSTIGGRVMHWLKDSRLNVFSGRGMSTGRFYEMHARLHGQATAFGRPISTGWPVKGGRWYPQRTVPALKPYGNFGYLLHGRPDIFRLSTYPGVPNLAGSATWWMGAATE